jgi:hypothetical protein
MSADDLFARAEADGRREGIASERARIARFLRAEAGWFRGHRSLHDLRPYDALTIVAEAIESGEYLIVPKTTQVEGEK